jgi:hypothetical protein
MFNRKPQPGTNSGIQNSGSMKNVQNQPGAFNSTQSQDNSGLDKDDLQGIAELLVRVRQEIDRDRDQVDDYDVCVGFLDMVAEQRLESTAERAVAKGLLEKVQQKCGGVPGLVSLLASTLAAISALA